MEKISIDELAAFCKRKGFVFPSSEIYGGLSGFWDFGHLGAELMNNIKREWWNFFVQKREDMFGIDASIISHPKTWKASGHIESFNDVSIVCKKCKKVNKIDKADVGKAKCEFCKGELDAESAKEMKLLFSTTVGTDNGTVAYLRGETAQGMFLNFRNIADTGRAKLPFGIAQIGKCFRNEIAPRDFLFRLREFTIAEFEFFIHPDEEKCEILDKEHLNVEANLMDAETQIAEKSETKKTTIGKMLKEKRLGEWHGYWLAEQLMWFKSLGLNMNKIKIREHTKQELSHYSSATFDVDYEFPFGSKEIAGNANRGQYDLNQHIRESKEKLEIFDDKTKKGVIPKVIEPTFGVERAFLSVLVDAYDYDKKRENVVLHLNPRLAPIKAAIFPIVNKPEFEEIAREIVSDLKKEFNVVYDRSGSIGRRYSRNDEIGTPACITVDAESLKDETCTVRERDTTEQVRVKISELRDVLRKVIDGESLMKLGKRVETRVK